MDKQCIVVVGVGGAGGNMVNNMIAGGDFPYHTIIANTDAAALEHSMAAETLPMISLDVLPPEGVKGSLKLGIAMAILCEDRFLQMVDGYDTVVFAAGFGGGTGTGATQVFADAARKAGKKVVCLVFLPFQFEGAERGRTARAMVEKLADGGHWIETFDNQDLFSLGTDKTTFAEAFRMADNIIQKKFNQIADHNFKRAA